MTEKDLYNVILKEFKYTPREIKKLESYEIDLIVETLKYYKRETIINICLNPTYKTISEEHYRDEYQEYKKRIVENTEVNKKFIKKGFNSNTKFFHKMNYTNDMY